MIENFISWVLGYVDFYVYGDHPERFITLAARNGIRIWNIGKNTAFSCTTSIGGYKELRQYAEKCRVRTKIYKKSGLPFFARKMRKRKGLFAGVLIFIAIYCFLFSYTWSIDVEGNEKLSKETVLKAAEECGLRAGTLKNRIDPYTTETQLMLKLPELSWVSVNTYGCMACISVKEKILSPKIKDISAPANIIASCPGQIIALEIFGGEEKVKVGDGVAKGQLLVSGVVSINDKDILLKHSYGRIIAKTSHELTFSVPKTKKEKVPNGENVYRCSTRLFGLQIPLTFCGKPQGNFKCETEEKPFKIGNVILPMSILEERWIGYDIVERKINKDEAVKTAEKFLKEKFKSEYPKAEIINKKTEVKENKNGYYITWFVSCKEDIGKQIAIIKD